MLSAATAACLISGAAAAALRAPQMELEASTVSFQQTGFYQNFPISEITNQGYKTCYSTLYSTPTTAADLSKCSGDGFAMVIVASIYGTSASNISVGAGGLASNVFATTGSSTAANFYDNVYWYNYRTKSFGFSDAYTVSLYPGDTYDANDEKRLSWNLENSYGGYRSGKSINLNADSTWRKVIYVKTDPLFRIVRDYAISDLTSQGFKLCYDAPFSHSTSQTSLNNCNYHPEAKVFIGAVNGDSGKFAVAAGGVAGKVFAKTASTEAALLSNGVYWYNVDGKSFGFSPNSRIFLADADTYDINSESRLSWHVNGDGGWRAGSANSLSDDDNWRKVIYYKY